MSLQSPNGQKRTCKGKFLFTFQGQGTSKVKLENKLFLFIPNFDSQHTNKAHKKLALAKKTQSNPTTNSINMK